MMSFPRVTWDRAANAAAIEFSESREPRRGVEVQDGNGDVIAVLHFSPAGELVELELLDAEVQLPGALRN